MPDENKRPITRKPSSQETSTIIRRNSASGLSLPVALSFFFVIMLIATVWSAAQLSLSWPFLILFTCASLSVVTFTRFEGLFLATCSVPIFFGLFSVAAGWLISELQTTTDTRGATSLVASFYPFVQHFPVLLITALGVVIIAVFRWTAMAHKVTAEAERGEQERKKSHISNARLSQQSSAARRLNTDSPREDPDYRQPESLKDRVLSPSQTSESRIDAPPYRQFSSSSRQFPTSSSQFPTSSQQGSQTSDRPTPDLRGRNALELGNQRSLQGSTQVPLLIDGKKPTQDYAGGIVSSIPQVREGDFTAQPGNFSTSEPSAQQDASLYSPDPYHPGSTFSHPFTSQAGTPQPESPQPIASSYYPNSPATDFDNSDQDEEDIDRVIDDLARGNFGDLATSPPFEAPDLDNEYEDYSPQNPDPVYPQFRTSFTWRKKPSKHTTDTGQIDVSDILDREQHPDD